MANMTEVTRFINIIGTALYEYRETHDRWLLPSVGIAQLACETGWELNPTENNYGGIKATEEWKKAGKRTFFADTQEDRGNGLEDEVAEFKAYDSLNDFLEDYLLLLLTADRYAGCVNNTDYVGAITAIKNGGYATSRTYISTLTEIIEDFNLTVWDKQETIVIEVQPQPAQPQCHISAGVQVRPKVFIDYNGTPFTSYAPNNIFDVMEDTDSDRLVIGFGGTVTCAINMNNVEFVEGDESVPFTIKAGDKVRVTSCTNYDTGDGFANYAPNGIFDVIEVNGERAVIGFDGAITAPVNVCYLELA